MNRSELCARVAARSSLSKADVAAALGPLTSAIADTLAQSETITVADFGKFVARTRAARQGRDHRPASPSPSPLAGCRPSRPAAKALHRNMQPER